MLPSCEMQGLEELVCVQSIQDMRAKCSYRVFCPNVAPLCVITAGSVHAASQRLLSLSLLAMVITEQGFLRFCSGKTDAVNLT